MVLFWILLCTGFITLLSLIGVFTLSVKKALLDKVLLCLIGFSAGALISSAFLHILPEALETVKSDIIFYYVILGIILFFVMERYFYWRHCHNGICSVHAFTYLNLIGDAMHNFIDGIIIAASFLISVKLGVITTMVVAFHELPQELGDFGVLVYGGFSVRRALFYNFICACTAMLGAVSGYFLSGLISGFSTIVLPLTAGGFIYISVSDLMPQLHKETDKWRSLWAFLAFLLGIIFIALGRVFFEH